MQDKNEKKRLKKLKERNAQIIEHSGNFSPIELINSGKATRYSTKKDFNRLLRFLIKFAIACAVILSVIFAFFRISDITVTNEEDFSAEEIISASGIKVGQNLVFLNSEKAEAEISEAINYASEVKVSKIIPSKVKISLSKAQGAYYTKVGRSYYVLDENCRVISKTSAIEDIELMGCIRLQSGKIKKCMLGSKLQYSDIDMQGVFDELIALLDKHELKPFCKDIILDSKFDIMFTYKERYTVRLGDLKDLDIKFQFLMKIIETLSDTDSGIINVSDSDLHEGIVTLYS